MKHPSNEDGRREGRPDAPKGAPSDGNGGSAAGFLSRADFEAALPLYVGGELDRDERARVDSWLAEHPDDRGLLGAASASRSLLQDHAAALRAAPCPDLWAGIRGELASSGLFVKSSPGAAVEPANHTAGGPAGGPAAGHSRGEARGRRSAGAAPRWYERRGFAAAAAVLLFGGLGAMLFSAGDGLHVGGGPSGNPGDGPGLNAGASGRVAEVQTPPAPVVFSGTEDLPAEARLAGTNRGVRLHRAKGPAKHILDDAVPLRLEEAQLPGLRSDPFGAPTVRLTGNR